MQARTWMTANLVLLLTALSAGQAMADDEHQHMGHMHSAENKSAAPMPHEHGAPTATTAASDNVAIKLSDKALSDQDGRNWRLKSELVGDRIVVVAFIYTTCTTVCPLVSATLSNLQKKLGSRLDKEVRLISLSVDPVRDTPARLKTYAAQYDARPGWFWLTGQPASVSDALKGFGAYTENFENHPVIFVIGDGKSGKWSRHYGLSNADYLLARVDAYLAARDNKAGNATVPAAMAPTPTLAGKG